MAALEVSVVTDRLDHLGQRAGHSSAPDGRQRIVVSAATVVCGRVRIVGYVRRRQRTTLTRADLGFAGLVVEWRGAARPQFVALGLVP